LKAQSDGMADTVCSYVAFTSDKGTWF